VDGSRIVAGVVIAELLQPFQLGADGSGAGEVGVEGGWLGVHRGLRVVIDDTTMNALFYREAKRFQMHLASITTPETPDLIDCNLCHRLRLYAIRSAEFRGRSE
jgi:hypothetical protein